MATTSGMTPILRGCDPIEEAAARFAELWAEGFSK
jgi:hypothetical protein